MKQFYVDFHRVRMLTLKRNTFLLTLLVLNLGTLSRGGAQYQYGEEESPTPREEKIFSRRFWDGFERGMKDTAGVFSRVSDNLEVAFDQMATDFSDNLSSFADKIERRVGDSLPPFLRERTPQKNMDEPLDFEAIGGIIGGVDDGLEVYYNKEGKEEDTEEPVEGVRINPSMYPRPIGIPPAGGAVGDFDFGPDIFNPFQGFGGNGGGLFNIFRRRKPWWQGQNVCIDREEIDDSESNNKNGVKVEVEAETRNVTEGTEDAEQPALGLGFFNLQMSSCRDSVDKYSCVSSSNQRGLHKTVRVSHRCCHGFVRDGYGCTRIDIFPMPETLEKLSSTSDFLSLIKTADLIDALKDTNLTIFAPTNEAIAEYTADLEERNEIKNNIDGLRNDIYRRKRETHNLAPTLLGHMTEGFVYAGDFTDEMVLPSLNKKSSLRINLYSGFPPVVTINCARVVTANQHSLNGVVHTIDRVIQPVVKNIVEIVDSDPQFTILKKLLSNSGLVKQLSADGQFTLFAPTDAAFRRLKPLILESLLEGSSCLEEVIKQHILPNTICSTSIQSKMKTITLLNDYLIVERNEDDKLFVNDAQIVAKDIVGTNGVIHIIDKALIPNEAKSVSEVLEFHNLTKFMELLELAQLSDEFDSQKDITVFAPTNNAIEAIPEEELNSLKNNPEKLKEALRYHMTIPSIRARSINNNQLAETAAKHPLRINLYSGVPFLSGILKVQSRHPMKVTAGCSRVSVLDSRACGAVVHVVESMLQVPKSNILAALEGENFSLFKQMVEDTGMRKELEGEGPYTVLIPSDHALKTLPADELEALMKDQELKEKLVKKHILKEHICCSGINPSNWLFMDRKRALDGSNIHIRRSHNGRLMAGPARIIECGSPTSNGIVHTLNRLVVSEKDMVEMTGRDNGGMKIFPISDIGKIFVF